VQTPIGSAFLPEDNVIGKVDALYLAVLVEAAASIEAEAQVQKLADLLH
jgi:hypothetical protein